jgi:hypothetical protein
MAVARRLFAGGAVQTTLVSPISATDVTITIAGDVGWPVGAEEFFVVVEPDQANEEKMLVTRSGTTLTAASTGKRGVDGTAATSHPAGAVLYPCVSATDLDDANRVASRLTSGSIGQIPVSSSDDSGFDWVTPADPGVVPINTQTGTTYSLVLDDRGKLVTLDNVSPVTVTVPAELTVDFPVGSKIDLFRQGTGTVTVAGASGVTLRSRDSDTSLSSQYSAASLVKIGVDEWLLVGDLA